MCVSARASLAGRCESTGDIVRADQMVLEMLKSPQENFQEHHTIKAI
jgi:hypothetical protein